jgi:hypothetical protein
MGGGYDPVWGTPRGGGGVRPRHDAGAEEAGGRHGAALDPETGEGWDADAWDPTL